MVQGHQVCVEHKIEMVTQKQHIKVHVMSVRDLITQLSAVTAMSAISIFLLKWWQRLLNTHKELQEKNAVNCGNRCNRRSPKMQPRPWRILWRQLRRVSPSTEKIRNDAVRQVHGLRCILGLKCHVVLQI